MIYSATGGAEPRSTGRRSTPSRSASSRMAVCLAASTTARWPTSRTADLHSVVLPCSCVLFFGAVRGGSRRWIDLGIVQPAAVGIREGRRWRWCWPSSSATSARGVLSSQDLAHRRRCSPPCRCCSSRGSPTSARRSRSCRCSSRWPSPPACRCAIWASLALVAHRGGAGRLDVRAPGLPEGDGSSTFLDPEQDARGRRLSADSGPHHRRLGRGVGQGLHEGHAGPAAVPAGGAQRFHLLGAGRGTGLRRRHRGARALPVRHLAVARRRPARKGPAGRVPGAGRAGELHVPGRLQHHHVGGSRAGQGTHAAAA